MKFDVLIYRQVIGSGPDIRTWVEVDDPVTAALMVMDRFRIRLAVYILVYGGSSVGPCAEFSDVDLDAASVPSESVVSYDYNL